MACFPVRENAVWVVWLMVVVGQPEVVWQVEQLVPQLNCDCICLVASIAVFSSALVDPLTWQEVQATEA